MFARLKNFFKHRSEGREEEAVVAPNTNNTAASSPPPSHAAVFLSHTTATEELSIVRTQLATVRMQMDDVMRHIDDVSRQEQELLEQRETVMMECHDAYLHPQLDGLPGPSTADDPSTALVSSSSGDDDEGEEKGENNTPRTFTGHFPGEEEKPAAPESPSGSRRAARMARRQRRLRCDAGVEPTPSDKPQTEETVRQLRDVILRQRATLGEPFARLLRSLRLKRAQLDDTIGRLDVQVCRLEADEQMLARSLREMDESHWRHEALVSGGDAAGASRRSALHESRLRAVRGGATEGADSSSDEELYSVAVPSDAAATAQPSPPPAGAAAPCCERDDDEMSDRSQTDEDNREQHRLAREVERLRHCGDANPPLHEVVVESPPSTVPSSQ